MSPMLEALSRQWDLPIQEDVLRLFLGERLGQGATREVFVLGIDPERVVKIENKRPDIEDAGSICFQNILEAWTWKKFKDTRFARWLAPVHFVSPLGSALVMARTRQSEDVADAPPLPRRVPCFLSDTHDWNWGLLRHGEGWRWVCHDYGMAGRISVIAAQHTQLVKFGTH